MAPLFGLIHGYKIDFTFRIVPYRAFHIGEYIAAQTSYIIYH